LGQALVAASRTVEPERHAHSLHGYFLRPGDMSIPILYVVDRIRDGKSFTTRRVVAVQHGKAIFNMAISFQVPEDGLSHQFEMPDVPPPEGLEDEVALRRRSRTRWRGSAGGIPARAAHRDAPVDPTDFSGQAPAASAELLDEGPMRCRTIIVSISACSRACRTGAA
jgi:acyl-CoA thioesterase